MHLHGEGKFFRNFRNFSDQSPCRRRPSPCRSHHLSRDPSGLLVNLPAVRILARVAIFAKEPMTRVLRLFLRTWCRMKLESVMTFVLNSLNAIFLQDDLDVTTNGPLRLFREQWHAFIFFLPPRTRLPPPSHLHCQPSARFPIFRQDRTFHPLARFPRRTDSSRPA